MKSHRVTILRKGLMVLALPLLCQALFLGVLLKRQYGHNEAQLRAVHTKDVLLQIDLVYRLLLSGQSNQRAFVLIENDVFAEAMLSEEAEVGRQIKTLETLIQDNPQQQQRFRHIAPLIQARLDYQQEILAKMKSEGRETVVAEVHNLRGKHLMDALSREIKAFRQVEEELDSKRLEELHQSSVVQNWLLGGGLIFNLAVGALAAVVFSREIGGRIRLVAENTRRIARGEALPAVVAGSDEITQLDQEFHDMAGNLAGAQRRERVYQETLERRAAELQRANRDLDQKNQEIEMFVYGVSHDLRSPLVNLQGFSQELALASEELRRVIANGLEDTSRERAKELVERDVAESIHYIQTAVTRLSSIIDALLRLSRAGRVEYRAVMVETAPVVARIVAAMRGSIVKCGAQVTIHSLPPVWADPTALEQILANLIGNAVNYLDPERPGEIEIGTVARTVEGLEDPRTYYVKDNGLGIAPAWLPKVFAIFQRLHGNSVAGEGVGLALVRRMVERHGGRVSVESVEGQGSTFFFALPASRETSPLPGVAPRKESISLRPLSTCRINP